MELVHKFNTLKADDTVLPSWHYYVKKVEKKGGTEVIQS